MNASPPPKRLKLDPSPSPHPEDIDTDDLEHEHCTICLQSFLDRTIIPVCAHEFCFECILLWAEQSRKCPLCSRSFEDSYLIHHVRSQYDYQKHYLLPLRSSPPLPLAGESRANALRNTRRERQWGRRQRQQREEADHLERAIARRRWIYQHHRYAKHVASNPYTRYRPFPTPAQFAASPDLVSRMTTFLRRELRVWPNLDVEFLTTYTISLMKSIDIRSESAVKLLSEFLDLDTPYTAGARHVHAEHFAHEIYSYLRSPYRDLNTYDKIAQYDAPPEISPPQEIERGSRWSAEPSPSGRSRSRSSSRYQSSVLHRENNVTRSPAIRHGRDSSAEAHSEDGPNGRHNTSRSPRGREDQDPRNHSRRRRHSPPNGALNTLRNSHSGEVSCSEASGSATLAENQDNNFPIQLHFRGDEKGNGQVMVHVENTIPTTGTPKMNAPQVEDSAAALETGEAGLIDRPAQGGSDEVADNVDNVLGGSSANPHPLRKRWAGLSAHVRPRNRTLSESVQAYLARPIAPWHPIKRPPVSAQQQLTQTLDPVTGKLPSHRKTAAERTVDGLCTSNDDDAPSEQPRHGRRSQSHGSSSNCAFFTRATRDDRSDRAEGGVTPEGQAVGPFSSANGCPEMGFPPRSEITPLTKNAQVLTLEGSLVGERSESAQMPRGIDDECTLRSDVLGEPTSLDVTEAPESLGNGGTNVHPLPAAESLFLIGGEQAGWLDLASGESTTFLSRSGPGPGSGSGSASVPPTRPTWPSRSDPSSGVDVSALETRLRTRTRVRVRLAAMKARDVGGGVVRGSDMGSAPAS